jgi:hypothetical protein
MPGLLTRRRPLPKPSPDSDPRYRKVIEQLKRGAARVKAHPSAARKAAEASKAAKGPPNERLAAGKAKQVEKIEAAPTSKPQPSSFLEVLQAEIAKAMPKTLDDTAKFMKGGSAEELKGSLKGNVAQQKDKAEGGVKSASKEAPKETGPGTPGAALASEAPSAAPPVNGADAMPAPKSDADVSLQDSKQETADQMKEADVTETQLKKANDPRFSSVLTAKDQVAKQADAAPAQYRGQEKQVLSASAVVATVAGAKGAHAMVAVRGGSNSAVLSRQAAAKAKDEAKRKEVVDHIEQIYNRTKQNVEAKLSSLETDVNALFDAGTDAAVKAMTDYTEAKIDEYKDDRYSGVIGKGRWVRDQFKGLPDEANVFYEQGRALFTRLMNAMVVKVAAIVEQRLKDAKDEVSKGQAEIKSYVDSQPKELQGVAKKAQDEVTERFHELEHSIEDKKQQLAESLAQKYKEGFDKANEALKKIQDANKGLVAGFIEKLKAVIEAIIEFKNKLMGVLRKGAAALKLIIADPIGFLGNLLSAIKQGFSQFASNIWTHLKAGFMKWMFGSLAEMGVELPTDLTIPSILKLVLGVLGITYERMRAKAVRLVGERAVKFIEKVADYIKTLLTGGFAALWEKVREDLSNLKEMVIDAIQDWLITTIIKKAITKIATMFNPVGAIVAAIMAIIDVVMFIVEKANQILEFVSAVVDSVAAIAEGQIAAAANWIERALANMIPLLIGFLAQLLGLGGISKKIKDFITKVQDRVDKAIDKAIAKIVAMLKGLFGKGGTEASTTAPAVADINPTASFAMAGTGHALGVAVKGGKYQITMASAVGTGLLAKLAAAKATVAGNTAQYTPADFNHINEGLDGLTTAVQKVEGELATAKPADEPKFTAKLNTIGVNIGRFGQRWTLHDLTVGVPRGPNGGLLDKEVRMLSKMTTATPSGPDHLLKIQNLVAAGAGPKVDSLVEEARIALDAVRRNQPVEGIGREVYKASGATLTDLDVVTQDEVIQIKGGDYSGRENLGKDKTQFLRTRDYVRNVMNKMFNPTTGAPLPPKRFVMHFTNPPVHPNLVAWIRSQGVDVRLGPR